MKVAVVGVVGRTNAGKSTLVNALVGEKVSIVSSVEQTTRNTIRGIVADQRGQLVLLDTPGLHKAVGGLGRILNRMARRSAAGTDITCVVFDASQKPQDEDIGWMRRVANEKPERVVFVLNKADKSPFFEDEFRAGWKEAIEVSGSSELELEKGKISLSNSNSELELSKRVDPVWIKCIATTEGGARPVLDALFSLAEDGEPPLRRYASLASGTISSVTPLYYKYGFREVKHYYERLAAETSLPVIIYNIPALTGTTLSTAQLSEILSIPNVGGMKFTSSDFFQLERIRAAFPDKVFYNGSDEMLLSGLAAGADGGIGSTYNNQPKRMLKIYGAYLAGDMKTALAEQAKANEVIAALLKVGVLPGCKMLLRLKGFDYGECREPFLPLGEDAVKELEGLEVE